MVGGSHSDCGLPGGAAALLAALAGESEGTQKLVEEFLTLTGRLAKTESVQILELHNTVFRPP